jgi:hypothetical protein
LIVESVFDVEHFLLELMYGAVELVQYDELFEWHQLAVVVSGSVCQLCLEPISGIEGELLYHFVSCCGMKEPVLKSQET